MSLRSQPVVSEIVGRDRSPKVTALMIGCWSKDIWTSALSEMGQGELMGNIRCTRIPFILVTANQSHPSPLSSLTHPTHSKIRRPTSVPVPLNCSFVMILTTPYAYQPKFYVYPFSLSRSRLIAPSFRNHDDSAYCQPHSGSAAYTLPIVIYF